nr:retrotransposon Orf1 [Tanacetum cinerariifolium]
MNTLQENVKLQRIKKTEEESMSYQAKEEHPTNNALMALTSSGSSSSLGLQSVEERLAHYKKNGVVFKEKINILNLEVKLRDNALVENKKKLKKAEKERDVLKLTLEKFQNSSKTLNNLLENQENVKSRSDKRYHAILPPYTGNYIPPKPDLMFMDEQVKKTKHVRKNSFSPPIIEDWNTDDESEVEFEPKFEVKTVRPSIEKIKSVKTAREKVEKVETAKQNKNCPRGNQRNWNNLMSQRLGSNFRMINKACFICGSFKHLHYICDQRVVRPVWNTTRRVNHKKFANKMTHPHPKRRFVLQEILTKPGKLKTAGSPVNTVRPVNTADSKPIVNYSRPISSAFKRGHSQVIRTYNKYSTYKKTIFNKMVNTVRVKDTTVRERAVVSEYMGREANAVKASACWV